jgi:hypothetical protein
VPIAWLRRGLVGHGCARCVNADGGALVAARVI